MAITFTATRADRSGAGETLSPNITGLSVAQGDGIIVIVSTPGLTVTGAPVGKNSKAYRLESSDLTADYPYLYVYSTIAEGSDEPNPTITLSGSGFNAECMAIRVRGQWASLFFDAAPTFAQQTGAGNRTSPSITPTNADCMVVSVVAAESGPLAYTAVPSGHTLLNQAVNGGRWLGASYVQHTTGATGTLTWTTSGGGDTNKFTFAVIPAAAASEDAAGGRGGGGIRLKRQQSRKALKTRYVPIATQALWTGREKNHPAAWCNPTHRVEFKRTLQRTVSIAGFQIDPRKLAPFVEPTKARYVKQERRLQKSNLVPAQAAQSFTAQGYPAWGIKRTRFAFKRRVQRLVHSFYPATPAVSAQPPSAFKTHFEKTRNQTNRRRLRVVHPPSAPLKASTAAPSAFALKKAIKVEYTRTLRKHPLLSYYRVRDPVDSSATGPVVPFAIREERSRRALRSPFPTGAAPNAPPTPATEAQILLQRSFHVEQKRRLLVPPIHNVYPETPLSVVPVAAVAVIKAQLTRRTKQREVEFTAVIVDSLTAAVYPASVWKPAAFIRHDAPRRVLVPPNVNYPAPRAPSVADLPAFALKTAFRTERKRVRRDVPKLSYYLTTPSPVVAWTKPKAFRVEYVRRLQRVPLLLERPQTPPVPFSLASLIQNRAKSWSVRFVRRDMPPLGYYHEAPSIDGFAGRTAFLPANNYVEGEITNAVYLAGEITTEVVLITVLLQ